MAKLSYLIAAGLMHVLSWLPMWMLYGLSTGLRVVMFDLIGYRRVVVDSNLANAFPEKSEEERRKIRKGFEVHLMDLIVEVIKELSASPKMIASRVEFDEESLRLLRSFGDRQCDCIVVLGHFGNWEWGGVAFPLYVNNITLQVLYSPLKSKDWDKFLFDLRARYGFGVINMKTASEGIEALRHRGSMYAFIADQAANPTRAYWTEFLNQETAVFRGAEHYARKYDLDMIYTAVNKPRRGHYQIKVLPIAENLRDLPPGEATERFVRQLEADIREQPEIWLWSHRRWKHKRPEGVPFRQFVYGDAPTEGRV